MLKIALSSVVAAAVLTVAAPLAFAQSELDNSKAYTNFAAEPSNNNMVILRVDNKTNSAAVLSTTIAQPPANAAEAQQIATANNDKFAPVASNQMASQPYNELDQKSGTPSWYFVGRWGGYQYPVYGYGYGCGYYCYPADYSYYTPVYNYYTPAYSYYYYNTGAWGWNTGWYGGWSNGWRGGFGGRGYGGGRGWGGRR